MEERRLGAPLLDLVGDMEAGAVPGKQYLLFDQYGSRGTMLLESAAADGQPKLLARYDASDVLRSRGFTGGAAGGMLEMVCGGRLEQRELQESRRPEDEAIVAQASMARAETSSTSWHENSQEIEALMMESDDDEVTSGLAHSSIVLGDQSSDGEGSVASGAEQRFWDDSLLSVCRASAPSWNEVKKRRIRRRMKTLRSWVPDGSKLDATRVLEEVIRYIRSSQQQIERNIQY